MPFTATDTTDTRTIYPGVPLGTWNGSCRVTSFLGGRHGDTARGKRTGKGPRSSHCNLHFRQTAIPASHDCHRNSLHAANLHSEGGSAETSSGSIHHKRPVLPSFGLMRCMASHETHHKTRSARPSHARVATAPSALSQRKTRARCSQRTAMFPDRLDRGYAGGGAAEYLLSILFTSSPSLAVRLSRIWRRPVHKIGEISE
jgi:hypothetical protein